VAKSVSQVPGVVSSDLNFASGVLLLEFMPALDPRESVLAVVRKAGHGAEPLEVRADRGSAVIELADGACAECAADVRRVLEAVPGVSAALFDPGERRVKVTFDPLRITATGLVDAMSAAGLAGQLVEQVSEPPAEPGAWWRENRTEVAVGIGAAFIVVAWMLARLSPSAWMALVAYALAIVASGTVTWRRALVSLRAKTVDMNVLMSIAVVGAVAIGHWSEAATVIWLFALGGLLESRALERTRRSIRDLIDFAPPKALVRRGGELVEVAPADVGLGETLVVRPGSRIPLDGTVTVGFSAVDESPITGESIPVEKRAGDSVFAGSLNTTGLIEVAVTARAEDTTLARIVYLVEEAQASRAPSQRLVDRFTRYYTPVVVALSVGVALLPPAAGRILGIDLGSLHEWFYRGLVVLVVSCPCALVISTPVAIVSAITRAARDGVLVKGGAFIEQIGRIKAFAFDKTGTLTRGTPEVAEVVTLDGTSEEEALAMAGALESNSTHPLARALVRAAGEDATRMRVRDFADLPGLGVRGVIGETTYEVGGTRLLDVLADDVIKGASDVVAEQERQGRTALVLVRRGLPVAVISLADALRAEARRVIAGLRDAGVEHVVMLTGDNERTAQAIAEAAGMSEHRARLLPEEKVDAVRELRARYGMVGMAGDGVNDAPALAAADIGIAMGAAGSDTALETADVALMADDLAALPGFVRLGRRTVAIIGQNVTFSVAVKAVTLALAVVGIATLWIAVFADMGVALLVIVNSMRLLRRAGRVVVAGNLFG
jgi:Cd2+/Zn2+-exporting ATPase